MYAEVLIQYSAKSLDRAFTYHIPDHLVNDISKGMKVNVPFGKQIVNGFVINITDIKPDVETKDINSIVTKNLKLNDELLELGTYVKDKTLCSLICAYQTMLPTSMKVNNSKENYDLVKTYIKIKDNANIDEYISNNKRSTKQIEILNKLRNNKIFKPEINGSALKTLLDKGIVEEEHVNVFRINSEKDANSRSELTDEQKNVFDTIKKSLNKEQTFLLHGVTGSGKTEIYMDLIEEVIKEDKCAIMLVPEITLTTQIVKRFYNRFGNDVAIFHSSLSEGEKYDEYRKIQEGLVNVVVGTRSAIFTPINNLGIIIIDEEHSSTYKQENNPRYHAIDIAKWRSHYHNCPLVLGSATPSLESMARAEKGVYQYIPLKERIGDAKLPIIHIIDMAPEYRKRNMILSDELQLAIMQRLERHEQVMLLLNRRGYSTIITCQSCGYTYKCPYCDITLTYHKSSNTLRCHYCGHGEKVFDTCPSCKEKALNNLGVGTQKIEEELNKLFTNSKVLRMDFDTTSKKGMHEKMIESFRNHEYDVLLGTQMVAKGLDFPNVTLVGVINADTSLNIPDFRSSENTFSLLSQVAGRSGRSTKEGKVIIQTFNPEHYVIKLCKNHDYISFYKQEMMIRRSLKYPPYYYICNIRISGKDSNYILSEALKIKNSLERNLTSTIILGPSTSSLFKMNNTYRYNIILKYKKEDNLYLILSKVIEHYLSNNRIKVDIDFNPSQMI